MQSLTPEEAIVAAVLRDWMADPRVPLGKGRFRPDPYWQTDETPSPGFAWWCSVGGLEPRALREMAMRQGRPKPRAEP